MGTVDIAYTVAMILRKVCATIGVSCPLAGRNSVNWNFEAFLYANRGTPEWMLNCALSGFSVMRLLIVMRALTTRGASHSAEYEELELAIRIRPIVKARTQTCLDKNARTGSRKASMRLVTETR